MMSPLLWSLACAPSSTPTSGSPAPTPPTGPTGAAHTGATPGPTGHTGLGPPLDTGAPDYPAVVPPAVDCAAVTPGPLATSPAGADPLPFDTRADGSNWYAANGIFEGVDPQGAIRVWDLGGQRVREDPYGNVYWNEPPDLWRVPPGGAPEVFATGLAGWPRVAQDLEVHPNGSLIFAERQIGIPASFVTFVDPTGAVRSTETSALPTPLDVWAVAWAHDWRTLWVGTRSELYAAPVDPLGEPDWSQVSVVAPLSAGLWRPEDLAVDACGAVYASMTLGFGAGRVTRYDPATGATTALPGNVDHGYGEAPLRFGRAPGQETLLVTLSGGWSTIRREWLGWDVGVGAPAWP